MGWNDEEDGAVARQLLHELVRLLDRLIREEEPSHIDLTAMGLEGADRDLLRETLGEGEISAEVVNFGRVTVQESGYAGVWWVTHMDEEGHVLSEFLEVSYCPEVLIADTETVADAHQALKAHLFDMGRSQRHG